MVRKTFTLLLLFLVGSLTAMAGALELTSPNGDYIFRFEQKNQRLWYTVDYKGERIIGQSEMGLDIDNRLFESALGIPNEEATVWVSNLLLTATDTLSRDTTWHPLYGERNAIRDHYRQLTLHLGKGVGRGEKAQSGYDMRQQYFVDIEVRAYDEGIAFRYHLPETINGLFINITGERTQFSMPSGTVAYHEAWAQTEAKKVALADWTQEAERPLLLQLPSGTSVALLEAALTDYARGKFKLADPNLLQVSMYGGAEVSTPYNTPWRVVMAGGKPTELINHKDIVQNLNAPCAIADTSFIRPGKAYRCGRLERGYIMKGIRFARQQGLQYVELDAGWYGPEFKTSSSALKESSERNFTVKEVCDSARAAGLGVWVYVNQRALSRQLDSILPLYKEWGVAGIKFGFVQVGNQLWTTWLHDAVRKCADYGMLVDIHDEYRPTGVSRTFPNLLTQEGIAGNEVMPSATHNVTLPFNRYLCGPADYTLCYYCRRIKTTQAHQLAMAAVYYSPLQFMFWYDDPKTFDGGEELKFWKDMPATFDESIALDGRPGEYIVQARRSGGDWFVGVMTGNEGRELTLNTADFLTKKQKYEVEIYTDDPTLTTRSKVKSERRVIKAGEKLSLKLLPSGGAALHFIKLKN